MKKLSIVMCVFLLTGCSGKSCCTDKYPGNGNKKNAIATFSGGETITAEDISREIEKLSATDRQRFQTPNGRSYILNTLVERKLLEREAEKRRISEKGDIPIRIENCRRQIIVNALKEEIASSVPKVSEADVLKYYSEHRNDYNQPQKIKVLDMVLKDDFAANTAMKRLKKGVDFGSVARELSSDPYTREKSGDIPEFSRETRPDLYDAVILKASPGRITGTIKSGGGIHILKLVKIIPPVERNFNDVEEQIKAKLNAARQSESYGKFMKGLKDSANIKLNEDLLAR